ncbi:protein-disulfide reductase DsbD [Ideonella sp. 4Y11]|uniref:Thiol:disulfide interchange protein DsbD n=1 Tax=Ideonella aquatica TaxID=2824119 RepID=A0A940YTP9_9BURK|nr:protein-disulfide reductase DsbD [Ideonella aquatica]MBQ0959155.1 protein-disulfide reductase DsbD [Ideonella aquatica]
MRLFRLFTLLLIALGASMLARAADFLEPDQAFKLSAQAAGPDAVQLRFEIADGYYLYRERFKFVVADGATLGEPEVPKGKVKFDETFQKEVETHRGALPIRLPVTAASGPFVLEVTSQGCADAGLCYPPETQRLQVSLAGFGGDGSVQVLRADAAATPVAGGSLLGGAAAAPPADSSAEPQGETARIERVLRDGNWWTTVGAFFVMGLLLAFTPCVLPMLPILSSVIAGQGEVSRRRSFALAVAYSLGMALVYTALGVAAGLAGEGLAAALQKPWVLASFALMLVAFSLAMFDVYELRLPSGLHNRLHGVSAQLPGGRFVGVFLMGGLSALIVSPCVSAPLAGALVFLSQSRDVVLAGSALFALACGMSVPLLALGASAGAWLPRSGSWMHAVKHFFGLLLLATALYIVQPVLPSWAVLVGWGALLLVTGFMLRPFDAHPHSHAPRVWVQRAAGIAALTLGVSQLVGAASGGRDPLQPLGHFTAGVAVAASTLPWQPVRSVAELDAALASAGRPVMLDFYADWCVSCKEMERFTFTDADVRQRLSGALLLKADVTANSTDDRALLKRFNLFGPPGTIFFDAQGREMSGLRVVGFENAQRFNATLQRAGL